MIQRKDQTNLAFFHFAAKQQLVFFNAGRPLPIMVDLCTDFSAYIVTNHLYTTFYNDGYIV